MRYSMMFAIVFVLAIILLPMPPGKSAADIGNQTVGNSSQSGLQVLNQITPASTVSPSGDINPYGVAFVPDGFSQRGTALTAGDILVSNFNNQSNLQGTGRTIVRITPTGQTSVFFQGNAGLGLTTALGVLKSGFVLVGSVPSTDGTCGMIQQGSLLVLNGQGQLVMTLSDPALLDSPWDLAILEEGHKVKVFVSNVISGTVTRLGLSVHHGVLQLESKTQIASGFMHGCNATALVVGPTGLAFDSASGTLYVASTADNVIFAVDSAETATKSAGAGRMVYSDNTHLHGPLGLVLAPNGNLLTSNGDAVNPDPTQASEIVEFTVTGTFISEFQVDTPLGAAFGIALAPVGQGFAELAAVNDNTNTLLTRIVRSQ